MTMPNAPDRTTFETLYAGQPPWETGRPQKTFCEAADQITGDILDSGCGTGENALFFAERGHKVTGIDFVMEAIERAKRKAAERGLHVDFRVQDVLTLKDSSERFDSVIDSGVFHVFSDDDRKRYVEGLATVLKPGGKLFLLCFSEEEPGTHGPRRVTQQELRDAFRDGWVVESIQASRYKAVPNIKDYIFSEGGPKAWFAVIRRTVV